MKLCTRFYESDGNFRGSGGSFQLLPLQKPITHQPRNGAPAFSPRNIALLGRHSESAPPNQQLVPPDSNCAAQRKISRSNGESWRPVSAAFLAQNGSAATAPRCFTTEPRFGVRTKRVCGGFDQREHTTKGTYLVRFLDDPGPITLPLTPAHCASSSGAVRGSWYLQVHLASAFARRFQRNADESRGAAVDN